MSEALRRNQWPKGVSGNPGGRTTAYKEIARLILDKTRNGAELVEKALATMRGEADGLGKSEQSRQYAHQWLSDRGLGRAPVDLVIELSNNDSSDPASLRGALIKSLDDAGKAALEVVLEQFERAKTSGVLALPAPADAAETP